MGKLLAVDGPDLVGKSTLVQHLALELRERGFALKMFRFPPDERSREVDHLYEVFTRSGDPMESQLALVKIFNAYGPKILAALREHDIVCIDRYMMSVLISCRALELDLKLIKEALRSALIPPDLTIIYTGQPFKIPEDDPPERKRFRAAVTKLFEAEIEGYRHPILRTTNAAAHSGDFPKFLKALADQVLDEIRLARSKTAEPTGRT